MRSLSGRADLLRGLISHVSISAALFCRTEGRVHLAKANPSLDDVLAECDAAQSRGRGELDGFG